MTNIVSSASDSTDWKDTIFLRGLLTDLYLKNMGKTGCGFGYATIAILGKTERNTTRKST
jgi:hypothetical protein